MPAGRPPRRRPAAPRHRPAEQTGPRARPCAAASPPGSGRARRGARWRGQTPRPRSVALIRSQFSLTSIDPVDRDACEHVWVAPHQLLDQPGGDVVDRPAFCFLGEAGVECDLQQHVPSSSTQRCSSRPRSPGRPRRPLRAGTARGSDDFARRPTDSRRADRSRSIVVTTSSSRAPGRSSCPAPPRRRPVRAVAERIQRGEERLIAGRRQQPGRTAAAAWVSTSRRRSPRWLLERRGYHGDPAAVTACAVADVVSAAYTGLARCLPGLRAQQARRDARLVRAAPAASPLELLLTGLGAAITASVVLSQRPYRGLTCTPSSSPHSRSPSPAGPAPARRTATA